MDKYLKKILLDICICLFILFHEIIRTAKNRLIKVPIIIDHSKYCYIESLKLFHTYIFLYVFLYKYIFTSIYIVY